MITSNIMGGLGNQLFQIFNVISYALENKVEFWFLNKFVKTDRKPYWDTFFVDLDDYIHFQIPNKIKNVKQYYYWEPEFCYRKIPRLHLYYDNIVINGYYQSNKYFEKHQDTIYQLIRLKEKQDLLKNKMLEKYNIIFDNSISMHFRLGDYKYLPSFHPIITYNYYVKSIQHILETKYNDNIENKITIFYIYEKNMEDTHSVSEIISKLKNNYLHTSIQFIEIPEKLQDWEEMLFMSLCQDNIIANSSFSWWGAYFNNSPDKIVTYPSVWFGTDAKNDTKDICPSQWKCIEC